MNRTCPDESNIFCSNCLPKDQNESTYKLSELDHNGKRWLIVRCVICGDIVSHKLSMWTELATEEVYKGEFKK